MNDTLAQQLGELKSSIINMEVDAPVESNPDKKRKRRRKQNRSKSAKPTSLGTTPVDQETVTAVTDAVDLETAEPPSVCLQLPLFDRRGAYGTLNYADDSISVRKMASIYDTPECSRDPQAMVHHSQGTIPFTEGDFVLPLGLTVITGATGVGKSSFIRALSKRVPVDVALAVEPFDTTDDVASMPYFDSVDAALMYLVVRQKQMMRTSDTPPVPVLDSLRQVVFETDGPAGERGMVMRFFTLLTRVSSALAKNGLSVVATVNPLQSERAVADAFIDRLRSAVPCVVDLRTYKRAAGKETFSALVTTRPDRVQTPLTLSSETPTLEVSVQPDTFDLTAEQPTYPRRWADRVSLPQKTI